MEQQEAIIEAVLFTMGESVSLEKLAGVLNLGQDETERIIRQMMQRYEQEDRGVQIIELDGSYQM